MQNRIRKRVTERSSGAIQCGQDASTESFVPNFSVPLCLGAGFFAVSAHAHAAAESLAPAVGAGSVLQVLLGLAVVLAMVFAAAWAMRRFNPHAGGSGAIRIVGGASVGNRERVLLLEVDDTWLVVGVAPGHVSPLHTMPRPDSAETPATQTAPAGFSTWLKDAVQKRIEEHRRHG